MKRILFPLLVFSFAVVCNAQDSTKTHLYKVEGQTKAEPPVPKKPAPAVKEIDPEIKELMTVRDTAKAALRVKVQENRKDMNHYDRMYNKNKTWKDQMKTAQKEKKTDKADELKEKVELTTDSIKELDSKLKADKKEIAQLQKDLDKAEVDLEKAKERIAKEKRKK
jgi:chromosome segregation ATPase